MNFVAPLAVALLCFDSDRNICFKYTYYKILNLGILAARLTVCPHYLLIYVSIHLFIYLCMYISSCVSVYLSICLSICLSLWGTCFWTYCFEMCINSRCRTCKMEREKRAILHYQYLHVSSTALSSFKWSAKQCVRNQLSQNTCCLNLPFHNIDIAIWNTLFFCSFCHMIFFPHMHTYYAYVYRYANIYSWARRCIIWTLQGSILTTQ